MKAIRSAVVLAAVALTMLAGCGGPAATQSPVPVPESTSSAPASPEPTSTASSTPAATGTTPARPLTPQEQYCADYRSILGSGVETQVDDENMNIQKLSAWLGEMTQKYQAASENAPKSLAKSYAKVIQFLKDFKVTVDTGNQQAIIAQMRYLPNLNSAMDSISRQSKKLCA